MTRYAIWSHRKSQWWRSNRSGYTDNLRNDAGLYTKEEAANIVFNALPGQNVPIDEQLAVSHFVDLTPAEVTKKIDSFRSY